MTKLPARALIDTCGLGHKFGRLLEYHKCPVCLEIGLAAARSAGPIMPEKPDYAILQYIIEAGYNYVGEEGMTSRDRAERAWDKIRRELMIK